MPPPFRSAISLPRAPSLRNVGLPALAGEKRKNPSPPAKPRPILSLARAREAVQSGSVKLLLNTTPDDGNGNVIPPVENKPQPAPAAPTAAAVVMAAQKTARELDLESELSASREQTQIEAEARKQRERDLCELQDKHENYRKAVETKPAPESKKSAPWTFFE